MSDEFTDGMAAAFATNTRRPGGRGMLRALAIALIVVGLLAIGLATAPTPPTWCTYPDDTSVIALRSAVDSQAAAIARNSPGQPIDRLTIQMGLMAQCEGQLK